MIAFNVYIILLFILWSLKKQKTIYETVYHMPTESVKNSLTGSLTSRTRWNHSRKTSGQCFIQGGITLFYSLPSFSVLSFTHCVFIVSYKLWRAFFHRLGKEPFCHLGKNYIHKNRKSGKINLMLFFFKLRENCIILMIFFAIGVPTYDQVQISLLWKEKNLTL